jgi:ligand-binding sensor domain-containing protein
MSYVCEKEKAFMKIYIALLLFSCLQYCKVSNHETLVTENQEKGSPARQGKTKTIVYFSANDGAFWQNKSRGLPDGIFLTDLATDGDLLALSTKQHGIFFYDFRSDYWQKTATQPPTSQNVDDLLLHEGTIWAGTQNDGVFVSADQGKSWKAINEGLQNLIIRRLAVIQNQVWACTNEGLYTLRQNKWQLVKEHPSIQINSITALDNEIYTGTTRGVFKKTGKDDVWKPVFQGKALHNINSIGKNIYTMVYGDLMVSSDKGVTWKNMQEGLPKGLYTFHVIQSHNTILAGQWDGVYKKIGSDSWQSSSIGLPPKFPAIEMLAYKDLVIAASSGWVKP